MKVLHVVDRHDDLAERTVASFSEAASFAQHEVLTAPPLPVPGRLHPAAEHSFRTSVRLMATETPALVRAVRALQPDVIHAHSAPIGFATRVGRRLVPELGRPGMVFTPHGFGLVEQPLNPDQVRRIERVERRLCCFSDVVATTTSADHRFAHRLCGGRTPIHLVHPAPYRLEGTWNDLPAQQTAAVAAGAVTGPAEDQQAFAQFSERLRRIRRPQETRFAWVDGERLDSRHLPSASADRAVRSVQVDQRHQELLGASLYVSATASGSVPPTVVAAAAAGMPAVFRLAPGAADAGDPIAMVTSLSDLVELSAALLAREDLRARNRAFWRQALRLHYCPESRRDRLAWVYAEASSDGSLRGEPGGTA